MKKLLVLLVLLGFLASETALAAFDRNLRYGARGEQVIELQEFLADQGVYNGPITGNFYSLTLKGVKAFQIRENLLPANGYFASRTRIKANELLVIDDTEEVASDPVLGWDLCKNLDNEQHFVPIGYTHNPDDTCSAIPQPVTIINPTPLPAEPVVQPIATDWCLNIEGAQSVIPLGMIRDVNGNCIVPQVVEPLPTPILAPVPVITSTYVLKDDFEGHGVGQILGKNGWTGGGTFHVVEGVGIGGSKALVDKGAFSETLSKKGSLSTNGQLSLSIKVQQSTTESCYFGMSCYINLLLKGGDHTIGLAFSNKGAVESYNDDLYTNLGGLAFNEWHLVKIQWKSDGTVRFNFGGQWSDWQALRYGGGFAGFDTIAFNVSGGMWGYFDNFDNLE